MHSPLSPRVRGAALAVAALASLVAACQDPASPPSARVETPVAANLDAESSEDPVTSLAEAVAGSQEMIAFASDRAGSLDVYVMDVATGRTHRLTRGKGTDAWPAWSPDGKRIALSSQRDGNVDIYVMNSTGGDLVRLSLDGAWDDAPTWSPDGTKIAYASGGGMGGGDIFVRNADATGPSVNLTNDAAYDVEPSWSPDGTKIAFVSSRGTPAGAVQELDVHLMNADGTGVTRLTSGGGRSPAWSPDGGSIAYHAFRDGRWRIYVVNADGTGSPVNLSPYATASDLYPRWSRDGTKLVFTSNRDGKSDVYVMNRDGSGVTRVGGTNGNDRHPSWRP